VNKHMTKQMYFVNKHMTKQMYFVNKPINIGTLRPCCYLQSSCYSTYT
jgi:hypothetical protein